MSDAPTTTYTVHIGSVTIETTSATVAELESEAGLTVTARTEGDR